MPAPERASSGGWQSFPAGAIMRCPGYNSSTRRACATGMGEVATGRRAFVRVKSSQADQRTMFVRRCRRCGCEVEVRFETPASTD